MSALLSIELLRKYTGVGPRYTSYPPADRWSAAIGADDTLEALAQTRKSAQPFAVYVHLPFCPSQCWFCACNVIAGAPTAMVDRYIESLGQEIALLAPHLADAEVVQLHFGGGSPTALTPTQLRTLDGLLRQTLRIAPDAEIAIEADPRLTTQEHLATLRQLGFNRLSLGVQDLDPAVQQAIHRTQSAELTERFMQNCRYAGFEELSVDLVYGLPRQTPFGFGQTLDHLLRMRPSRVAVYGYAHVPWMRPAQRRIDETELPDAHRRLLLFSMAVERFLAAGYEHIGLDHFALPQDSLAQAARAGTLQRNFMGYATRAGTNLIGLGVTSIGRIGDLHVQNERRLKPWQAAVGVGKLATVRGWRMTAEDLAREAAIQSLLCTGTLVRADLRERFGPAADGVLEHANAEVSDLAVDGLINDDGSQLALTPRSVSEYSDSLLAPSG